MMHRRHIGLKLPRCSWTEKAYGSSASVIVLKKQFLLKQLILTPPQLEKFKFVLDYKIKELKRQIEPRENEISDMRHQIEEMDLELEQVRSWPWESYGHGA